jgi:hypothetical protein
LLDGVPATEDGWEVPDPFRLAYAELVVKDRDRQDWWYPQGDLEVRLRPLGDGKAQLIASGRLRLDPERLAGGRPLERGVHDVWAYVQLLGVDRMVRVTGDGTVGGPAADPALIGGRLSLLYWTASGQLAPRRGPAPARAASAPPAQRCADPGRPRSDRVARRRTRVGRRLTRGEQRPWPTAKRSSPHDAWRNAHRGYRDEVAKHFWASAHVHHGASAYRNWGCRCEVCNAGHADRGLGQYHARKEEL